MIHFNTEQEANNHAFMNGEGEIHENTDCRTLLPAEQLETEQRSPYFYMNIIGLSIFIAEMIAMFLVSHMKGVSDFHIALMDSTILILLVAPTVYLFLVRPLTMHIHRQKVAEENLWKQEKQFRSIVDSTHDAVISINSTGTVTFWNNSAERMFGYSLKEIIGESITTIIPERYHEQHIEGLNRFLASYHSAVVGKTVEVSALAKNGREFQIELSLSVWSIGNEHYFTGMIRNITYRKRAAEALEESEQRFRSLTSSSPVGVFQTDLNGHGIYVNEKICKFTGMSEEEHYGTGWSRALYPDDSEYVVSEWEKTVRGDGDFNIEFRFTNQEGNITWVSGQAVSLMDADNNPVGFLGTLTDITAQKWIVEALAESEEYSRSFLESSQDCVCNLSSEGKFMSMNPVGLEINGIENPEDIVGVCCTENIIENKEEVKNAIKQASKGNNVSVQYKSILKSGEVLWWDSKLTPVVDIDGSIKSILRVSRDITKQKEAEDALQQKQAELLEKHDQLNKLFRDVEVANQERQQIMDCVGDMIILTDKEGRIRRVNMAVSEFTNLSFKELLGKDWDDLIVDYEMETRTLYADSTELLHKPSGKWFTVHSYPFHDNEIGFSGSVITIHDTSEIKNISEKLENAYKELKTTQSQILQREKMASIGQLAAGVAHEINNPMGFISSNIRTLSKYVNKLGSFITIQSDAIKDLDAAETEEAINEQRKKLKLDYVLEDVSQLIDESLDGAERVKNIVQNLKSFSRVDESENKMSDINECIETTLNMVWNELKYKATISKEYGDIPEIRCNPQQLNQVFVNLLINAGHAIEDQGEIRVKTWNGDGTIHISIGDTGCGIPADKIDRIFEPFFTTKDVGKGTGLGLSITYDIVKNHDGDISVESEPGKGTTFTVQLPLERHK